MPSSYDIQAVQQAYQQAWYPEPQPLPQPQTWTQPLTGAALSTLTGVDTSALEAVLFGKDIPKFVGGQALIGCRIIEGPFLNSGLVDFIATAAQSANPSATRTITSLRLNGTESWTAAGGSIGTPFAGMTVNVKTGTEDQTPFASSITRYGDRAVAYRSQICVEVINCPLSVFNNVIPFASIFVHESDSITRNEALTVLARDARFDDSEFEFDVSGSDEFWIVPQQYSGGLVGFLQTMRSIFRDWNITATDKLRVFENNAGDGIDTTITRSNTTAGSIKLLRGNALALERQRLLQFIDTDRDNDINAVSGRLERFPVSSTASQNARTISLPIGTTESAAQALVSQSLLIDDLARKKISYTGMTSLYGSEPGDIVYYAPDPNISIMARVTSVARKAADYATEITAEQIRHLGLSVNTAPEITSGASFTINENTTAVTTVTATDADFSLLTYSIVGGADQALFTINSVTGALSFITAPDFDAPTDSDADNVYVVIVQASDGELVDTQTITVTVANVVETPNPGTPIGMLLSLTREIEDAQGTPMGGLLLTLTQEI